MIMGRLTRIPLLFPLVASVLALQAAWGDANPVFSRLLNPDNLEAEQILPSTAPLRSDPVHLVGKLFKPLGMTGTVPSIYLPAEGQTLQMPTLLLDASDAEVIQADGAQDAGISAVTFVRLGRSYVRQFVHPLEAARAAPSPGSAPADPVKWIATPSSSTRSLLATDEEHSLAPFVAKTSLGYKLAGVERQITLEQAKRAVTVSSYLASMQAGTNGRIPNTDKSWTYFSEPLAIRKKGAETGFTIMRSLPSDYKDVDYLPFYALISDRKQGPRWIDGLYASSGYRDKLEFVWNEIARPLLELHLMIRLDNGLDTELHQQNALLRIDPRTRRVLGVGVRDMDGHSVDYLSRKYLLGLPVPGPALNAADSETFRFVSAQRQPMLGYEILKDSILKNTFRYFLSRDQRHKLVGRSNELIRSRFNSRYAATIGETRRFMQLRKAFELLYQARTPPEARAFFDAEARREREATPFIDRLGEVFFSTYYGLKQRLERTEPSGSCLRRLVAGLTGRVQSPSDGVKWRFQSYAKKGWLGYIRATSKNLAHSNIPLEATGEGQGGSLEIGERMGSGFNASVYEVRNPADFGVAGSLLVKLPHRSALFPAKRPRASPPRTGSSTRSTGCSSSSASRRRAAPFRARGASPGPTASCRSPGSQVNSRLPRVQPCSRKCCREPRSRSSPLAKSSAAT